MANFLPNHQSLPGAARKSIHSNYIQIFKNNMTASELRNIGMERQFCELSENVQFLKLTNL